MEFTCQFLETAGLSDEWWVTQTYKVWGWPSFFFFLSFPSCQLGYPVEQVCLSHLNFVSYTRKGNLKKATSKFKIIIIFTALIPLMIKIAVFFKLSIPKYQSLKSDIICWNFSLLHFKFQYWQKCSAISE